ncbi:hypothetical protein XELAEV_18004708mg [Xenopus laevis]|uniref:Fanconi anaemia group A protein N-terminal domain-containing protein n=1 Tax=Xenopus laevis TaxID=8355 RepID=A0A974GZP0_XENLA|nr:hypothetical protein XELAEV_18004708mg [Xenopus laevis]
MMSAVPGFTPSGQKRSLAELLDGRVKRLDRKSNNSVLQEAALYLLSCNQDVSQFLSEVEAPPYKKTCNPENPVSIKSRMPSAAFVGSTLKDQASCLKISPGILTAKAAVANIQQICQACGDSSAVLNPEQREKLCSLLKTLKILLAENCFCRSLFCKEIWIHRPPLVFEAVWHLHNEGIVCLDEILESCKDTISAVDWLFSEMCSLCLYIDNSSLAGDLAEKMISDFQALLVENSFRRSSATERILEQHKTEEICLSILDKLLSWLLDAVSVEKSDKSSAEQHWLSAFEVHRYRARVVPESIEQFFIHTLTQVLTFKPKLKVSDAIQCQANWSFVKTSTLLTDLYRKLFVALSAEKLIAHIQLVLDTQEVNWHHVLTCVSCLVICLPEAQQLIKDLLCRLLTHAFESYELEGMITAFLIVRQAALEGPAAFVSYTEWFKCTFGAANSYHGNSKKSLVFLLKFLSDIVPFEAPQYLKVHVLHPPFVPTKYRPLLMEYISLAKTRLTDMKVSIEDMGLYEDLSARSNKVQPESQAHQDVEKALNIFENTGKIPASVMEASIFRRPYFTSRFLPALLTPRVLPAAPDALMLLIDSMKRADKIPTNMFNAYIEACEQEKLRKQKGRQQMDQSLPDEPLGILQSALSDLRPLVTDANKYEDVSAQVAVISEKLIAVMGEQKVDDDQVAAKFLKLEDGAQLDIQEQTVADLLLTCFCQCLIAASGTNPPDRQGQWPTLYVKMLCGHQWAFAAVLRRMLQLLRFQAPFLKDSHIVGLAAFSIHLHECQPSLQFLITGVQNLEHYWENLLNLLCSDSVGVCLKLCTAAISYAFCRFSELHQDIFSGCVPPLFLRKLQYLVPRLIWETRGEVIRDDEEADSPLNWNLYALAGWKEAALSLWNQNRLQGLLREKSFQVTFMDWLLWEMTLKSNNDVLCDTDRQEYQRWAVNHYLSESSVVGGCNGDLERGCITIAEAVLQFSNRHIQHSEWESRNISMLKSHTGLGDILCRLQELICDIVTSHHQKGRRHFFFAIFYQRLELHKGKKELSNHLSKQGVLEMCCRILLGLPPLFLINTPSEKGIRTLGSEDFWQFVNKELKNLGPRGYALPYNITAHFFRGVISASVQCKDSSEAVNSILSATYSTCPALLISAAVGWPQLDPVLRSQWCSLFGVDLPKELRTLREQQASVDSCLSQGEKLSLSCTPWLSAAFLYSTVQRKKLPCSRMLEILDGLSSNFSMVLISLLFFSVMDIIYMFLKDGRKHKDLLENCVHIIHCLEQKGETWVWLFQMTDERKPELGLHLHRAASDVFLNLMPFAFFWLVPSLQLEQVVQQQDFLVIALDMYHKFLQLFVDGSPLSSLSAKSHHLDSHDVFTCGRQFLLCCVPKCQKPNSAILKKMLESWEEHDPELAAVLTRSFKAPDDYDDLFFEPVF